MFLKDPGILLKNWPDSVSAVSDCFMLALRKKKKKDSLLPTFISCFSFKKAGSYPFSKFEGGVLPSSLTHTQGSVCVTSIMYFGIGLNLPLIPGLSEALLFGCELSLAGLVGFTGTM